MENTILIIGGFYNLGFALFHIFFWKIFRWKADLRSVKKINKSITYVMNLCLIYVFILFGYLSFFQHEGLLFSSIGNIMLISISLFWFFRAILQVVFFDISKLISIIFAIIFLLGGILYLIPVIV